MFVKKTSNKIIALIIGSALLAGMAVWGYFGMTASYTDVGRLNDERMMLLFDNFLGWVVATLVLSGVLWWDDEPNVAGQKPVS